jgi:hypothetical protein
MPVTGRKPKPDEQKRNRHKPTYDWLEVPDVPFAGGPKLPARRTDGRAWPTRTKRWWAAISSMPHCVTWTETDWEYAIDTAYVHAEFASGDMRVAAELRNREKLLGNTFDSRRDLRIRYVTRTEEREEAAGVSSLDEYRAALA